MMHMMNWKAGTTAILGICLVGAVCSMGVVVWKKSSYLGSLSGFMY